LSSVLFLIAKFYIHVYEVISIFMQSYMIIFNSHTVRPVKSLVFELFMEKTDKTIKIFTA
ncbi:MAG TPA: hypothetical protein PLH58_06925, partial [Paludibacteraceae bacterium]|nr:hypothetical protein [Paludibacteraceae bacterium]